MDETTKVDQAIAARMADPEKRSNEVRTIAAVFGDDKGPSVQVQCRRCSGPAMMSPFAQWLWKTVNGILKERKEEPLKLSEVVCCDPCEPLARQERDDGLERVRARAERLLANARAGTVLSGEDLKWLHENGFRETLNRVLAEKGKLTNRKKGEIDL